MLLLLGISGSRVISAHAPPRPCKVRPPRPPRSRARARGFARDLRNCPPGRSRARGVLTPYRHCLASGSGYTVLTRWLPASRIMVSRMLALYMLMFIPAARPDSLCASTPGTFRFGAFGCIPCGPGNYCLTTDAPGRNNPCPANTYSSNPGANSLASCQSCPVGNYSSVGAGACCPIGYWVRNSSCVQCCMTCAAPICQQCTNYTACPVGTFSNTQGATSNASCTQCPAGTWGATAGLSTSQCSGTCSMGTYSISGSSSCTLCRANMTTFTAGSTSSFACVCTAGFFGTASTCTPCPRGHYCPTNTTSWPRLNCGRGNYCPLGSAAPLPCPIMIPPNGGWGAQQVQGPAFMVETAACLAHCFFDGQTSSC